MENIKDLEKLSEQLHIWYLEATKELNPKSFNSNAQKSYQELTEEQKYIDRYIANKILQSRQELLDEIWNMIFRNFPKDMENLSFMTKDQAYRLLKGFIKEFYEKEQ